MSDQKPLEWRCEQRRVGDLVPWEFNPRILTEKKKQDLMDSFEKFNIVEIPAINLDNKIIAGHQRIVILNLLGRADEKIDVRVPNRHLTVDEFREYNVRSNLNHGEWDWDMLANDPFDSKELIDWGFSKQELGMGGGDMDSEEGDDAVPDEVKIKVVAQPGDLFEFKTDKISLRLLCGDCRTPDVVKKLMGDELGKAHICITDPPYNVDYESSVHHDADRTDRVVKNDKMSFEDFRQFLLDVFASIHASLAPGGAVYSFMSSQEAESMMFALRERKFHWSSTIIWNKDRMVFTRKDYHAKYEPLFYAWKDGAPRLHPVQDRTQVDVWDCDRPSVSAEHPTTKPVALYSRALTNSAEAGETLIDFFNGSGTGGVAAIKADLNYRATEDIARFVDVALRRWHEYFTEHGIEYSVTRNGEPFTVPELYESTEDAAANVAQATQN